MRMPCCSLPSSLGLLSALPLNTWQPSRIPYLSDYQVGHEGSHQKCPQRKSFKIAKWAHPLFYSGAWKCWRIWVERKRIDRNQDFESAKSECHLHCSHFYLPESSDADIHMRQYGLKSPFQPKFKRTFSR